MVEAYLEALELGYYELQFAFEGMADENVWKRPAEGLLSVGELAGHIAYWIAVRFASDGGDPSRPDLTTCRVSSPLIDHRFAYYPMTIASQPSEQHLAMTAERVYREMVRVYEESVAYFKTRNPDLDSTPPGYPPEFTHRELLKYAAFHVAYHTGQMYSVRHLLGEETPDN
jgi:hypothetical protein